MNAKEFFQEISFNAAADKYAMGSKLPYRILLFTNFFYTIGWLIKIAILTKVCNKFGHKWIDESYGGPDSGCMAGTCARCGKSFHKQLY